MCGKGACNLYGMFIYCVFCSHWINGAPQKPVTGNAPEGGLGGRVWTWRKRRNRYSRGVSFNVGEVVGHLRLSWLLRGREKENLHRESLSDRNMGSTRLLWLLVIFCCGSVSVSSRKFKIPALSRNVRVLLYRARLMFCFVVVVTV